MVLGVDTSRRVTGLAALTALVVAVEAADPTDEDEFVEWKSWLDLGRSSGAAAVGRSILGFANRDPAVAHRQFEGCGYMLIGVEPRNIHGVTAVDPADLASRIDQYVGGVAGPAWDIRFVTFGPKAVAVVIVEPPKPGDPPWTFRKSFDKWDDGAVFHRRKGSTHQANSAEMATLIARSKSGPAIDFSIECIFEPSGPLPCVNVTAFKNAVHVEAEKDAAEMRTQAVEAAARRETERSGDVYPGLLPALSGLNLLGALGEREIPDTRTLDQYNAEVDSYVAAMDAWAAEDWLAGAWEHSAEVRLVVTNPTDTYLKGVRLVVVVTDDRIVALSFEPEAVEPPDRPHVFGEPKMTRSPLAFDFDLGRPSAYWPETGGMSGPDLWVERDGRIIYDVGDLRPRTAETSPPFKLVIPDEVESGPVTVLITATAEGHHRVVETHTVIEISNQTI